MIEKKQTLIVIDSKKDKKRGFLGDGQPLIVLDEPIQRVVLPLSTGDVCAFLIDFPENLDRNEEEEKKRRK